MVLILALAFLWWLKGFLVRQGQQLKKIFASVLETAFQKVKQSLPPFLRKRLDPSSFFGLPILSLAILVIGLFIFILVLGFEAPSAGTLWANLDERIASFFRLFLNDHVAVFAFLITALCFSNFIVAFSAVATMWFLLEKRKSYIVGLWTGVIGTALSSYLIKFIVGRPRPTPLFYFENSYSFPSTHAAIAVFLSFFLAYYAIRVYPRWSRNVSVIFAAIVISILIAWSRLYLGVHYFSDVIAGYALGGILLIVSIIIERRLMRYDAPQRLSKMRQGIVLAGATVFLVGIFFSQTFNKITLQDLYHALPLTSVEQQPLKEILLNNAWPLWTENLRGARERQVRFIFVSDPAFFEETLKQSGWVKRDEPTIGSVLQRASAIVFKTSYPAAPIRPRFWRNDPNAFSFTKLASGDKKEKDLYVLRLWRAPMIEAGAQQVYISELWVDRDLYIPLPAKQSILDAAREQLLHDISKNISKREILPATVPVNTNELEEGTQHITVEIIHLDTHE
jgi:undecaprenyl-diphosphatase